MDAKVVNGSLFLLSGKKDKLLLYHCRDSDVDVEAAEEMEASNKVQVSHLALSFQWCFGAIFVRVQRQLQLNFCVLRVQALCKSLKSNKIPFEYVQEDKTPGVPTVTHIMKCVLVLIALLMPFSCRTRLFLMLLCRGFFPSSLHV